MGLVSTVFGSFLALASKRAIGRVVRVLVVAAFVVNRFHTGALTATLGWLAWQVGGDVRTLAEVGIRSIVRLTEPRR